LPENADEENSTHRIEGREGLRLRACPEVHDAMGTIADFGFFLLWNASFPHVKNLPRLHPNTSGML